MARKVTAQSIIASNWPPTWNRWSSSRGLSAIAELLVITVRFRVCTHTDMLCVGLFARSHMKYRLDRQKDNDNDQPTLADMTEKAIEILSRENNGYFLLVEGYLSYVVQWVSVWFNAPLHTVCMCRLPHHSHVLSPAPLFSTSLPITHQDLLQSEIKRIQHIHNSFVGADIKASKFCLFPFL